MRESLKRPYQLFVNGLPTDNRLASLINPLFAVAKEIAPLLLLFITLDVALRQGGQLPPSSYENGWLLPELGRHLLRRPLPLIFLLIIVVLARRKLWLSWSELDQGIRCRWLTIGVALLTTWPFVTYDLNLFFGQAHLADRALLVVLFGLLFWRPIFLLPYLLTLYTIIWQFSYPLDNYPWTEMNLVLRVLTLTLAAYFLQVISGYKRFQQFVFVLFILIAAQYFVSGLGKVRLNWIVHPHLNLLLNGAYAFGWLRNIDAAIIGRWVERIAFTNIPFMIFTLFLEVGALFVLWRRWTMKLFLILWIMFHLGVFMVSGMFFWKWIGLELLLFALLFVYKETPRFDFFKWPYLLVAIGLIGLGPFWAFPRNLSWYDTPLTYHYDFEAVGASGERYALPSGVFSLYGDGFTLNNFGYLSVEPRLTHVYGVSGDLQTARRYVALETPAEVLDLEAELAAAFSLYDEDLASEMDRFLVGYFGHWNELGSQRTFFSLLPAPRHLWSFAAGTTYRGQEPVRRVEIYQTVTLYHDGDMEQVRRTLVRTVPIPP